MDFLAQAASQPSITDGWGEVGTGISVTALLVAVFREQMAAAFSRLFNISRTNGNGNGSKPTWFAEEAARQREHIADIADERTERITDRLDKLNEAMTKMANSISESTHETRATLQVVQRTLDMMNGRKA